MSKQRVSLIILSVFLANFFMANFAVAQATDPRIDPARLAQAQNNQGLCEGAFRTEVEDVTLKKYSTMFVVTPNRTGRTVRCMIVNLTVPLNATTAGRVEQTPGAAALQTQIEQGQGISANDLVNRELQDQNSQNEAAFPSKIIGWTLKFVFDVINSVIGIFTGLAMKILAEVVDQTLKVTTMPTFVNVGWTIMRDIANMFFILILIVIALAAILRIESYDYRHLLGELILMAILVNFSQVIAVTIINAVNVLISMFAIPGGMMNIYSFVFKYIYSDVGGLPNGWMTGLTQGITMTVFSLVTLVVSIMLAGLFIIRLVGLYILVIFSPLAYVLHILPATKNYAHEWWQYFIKYLIWGPVAMFMIRLAMLVADQNGLTSGPGDSAYKYIFLSAIMAGAVLVAEEAGMVGGKAVVGMAQKGASWAGHRGVGYAGRKYNEWSTHRFATPTEGKSLTRSQRVKFALVNPIAAYKGWSKRGEELSHHAKEVAVARGRESADVLTTGMTLPHAQFVERQAENAKLKLLMDVKKEQLADIAVQAEGMTGHEGEVMRNAVIKAMLANGYTDDVLRMKHFAEKYAEVRDVVDDSGNPTGEKRLVTYSPQVINRFLYEYLGGPDTKNKHMSEQSLRILAEDAEKYAKDTGHPEIGGHAVYDDEKRSFVNTMKEIDSTVERMDGTRMKEIVDVRQKELTIGEFKKLGGRNIIAVAPHGMAPQVAQIKVTADGKYTFTEDRRMLDKSVSWGSMDATPETLKFYGSVAKIVDSPSGMREVQHSQQRLRDATLSADMDKLGRLQIKTQEELRKIKAMVRQAPDLTRALYAQKMDVSPDQRQNIPSIKFELLNPDGTSRQGNIVFNEQASETTTDWDYNTERPKWTKSK